ncbi:HNH endonuclease [Bacillus altitudinis]|uniref:HNH endonuclease n=1 Tax=Bacillus altitudinis TaxID=293387 RepID=UPI0010720517|nr:HNH endonuclease [Bacillus altitudinis]MBU8694127.1 HNH endonuclease [Bacillus altitudinis]NMF14872.1 HNH endonuclease [Bacillus altitudinis]QEO62385.1 HNH endonuclease [Bacillus altitudinis]WHY07204.1 HNH endonuclease [Bacillus altitudinis]
MRNPKWSRDELILALDLYYRIPSSKISSTNEEVIKLSQLLNQIPSSDQFKDQTFRNPNGVSMKLNNFKRLDPDVKGPGLVRGGKLEEIIWNEFSNNRDSLFEVASMIKKAIYVKDEYSLVHSQEEEEYFPEGKLLFRLHKNRERDSNLVKKFKEKALIKGELHCSVCGFDFYKTYGEIGKGFIECHHTVPISKYDFNGGKTKLSDLILVCSNCHRMLHRRRPWLTVQELKKLLV